MAQLFIEKLQKSGDVYLGSYEGWYCIHDESFLLSSQLAEGACPDCGRPVEWVKEENYFFRLSKYADAVLRHIEENPGFVQPEVRRNEVVSFIRSGLTDQSISRTSFTWGIPLPFDAKHVMYVWFDALLNYISAIDYGTDQARFDRTWPADWHLVGKEILRFHAIIWPAMLMAAGLPLPEHVFAHGWLTVEGQKMSKSLGNVVRPADLVDEFGLDAYRYYFLREFSFGLDGNFSRRTMLKRYNAELANDLGNLESRVLTMVEKYREGFVPEPGAPGAEENRLREGAESLQDPRRQDGIARLQRGPRRDLGIHTRDKPVRGRIRPVGPREGKGQGGRPRPGAVQQPRGTSPGLHIHLSLHAGRGRQDLRARRDRGTLSDARLPASGAWGLLHRGVKTSRAEAIFPRKMEGATEGN